MLDNTSYEKYKELYSDIGLVLPENVYDYIRDVDNRTKGYFEKDWINNTKDNLKHNFKDGWINDGYEGLARNKAVIAVGAGPSFNRNKDVLHHVSTIDGMREFQYQDFITIVSNHQIKPCLEMGIIPHFAILGDASKNLESQMDVGEDGKYTTLIANIYSHPDVVKKWPGPVRFITGGSPEILEVIDKHLGYLYDRRRCTVGGGNVLNLAFMISMGLFKASAWICVGNDLSFPRHEDLNERRKGFYADGDYSTNIKSKRDEAEKELAWMGYEFPNGEIISPLNYVNFKLVNTSKQMFVYKTWLEATSLLSWKKGSLYTLYNCSEQGILGVVLKEDAQDPEKRNERLDGEKWMLMDEVAPNRWRTYKLEDALREFMAAKTHLYQMNKGVLLH